MSRKTLSQTALRQMIGNYEQLNVTSSDSEDAEDSDDELSFPQNKRLRRRATIMSSSDEFSSSSTESDDENEETNQGTSHATSSEWKSDFSMGTKFRFTGISGLQIPIEERPISFANIFEQMIDKKVIQLMVLETNRYAHQVIDNSNLARTSRMKKWTDTNEEEMRKFIAIIFITGIIKFPTIEDYWKLDSIFFHPIFHHIKMTYDRFSLILKNWHFSNNEEASNGDRLFKVRQICDMIFENIQKLYMPDEEIAIDETMISHRGRILFRQYNPLKRHKYGLKMFKLCDMSGFVWNAKIYCGAGSSQIRPGLDLSGSVVADLSESLLDQGRFLVTDNWYSSIPLSKFLLKKKTNFCGTIRKNRKGLPEVTKEKMTRGQIMGSMDSNGIRIFKYKDKKDVFMISTFHSNNIEQLSKKNRSGDIISKPSVIVDYNRIKGGIDLSDQMIEYYSPARKSVKWYRKIIFQLLSIAMLNTWIIYNKFYNTGQKKVNFETCTTNVIKMWLGANEEIQQRQQTGKHKLTEIPHTQQDKIVRKRCNMCYEDFVKNFGRKEAQNKAKKVSLECIECKKSYCLKCFNKSHEKK